MSEKFDELVDRFGSSCEVFAGMRLAGDMVGTPANEDANRLAANSQKEKTRAALEEYVAGLEEDNFALRIEIDKLREALADIAHGPVGYWNEPQNSLGLVKYLVEKATKALQPPEVE